MIIPGNHQTTIRFAVIGVIVLAMLIPLAMVEGVTEERQRFFDATLQDIANAWGNAQNLSGPFLIVPEIHRYQVKNDAGVFIWHKRRRERVVLPEALALDIQIKHQFRRRAIYEVPVYSADIRVKGRFPALDSLQIDSENVTLLPDQARMVAGISHTQAISTASIVKVGSEETRFAAGTEQPWVGKGVHAILPLVPTSESTPFEFDLTLRGTRALGFTPAGNTTEVTMSSTWPHPSFKGAYLPENYDLTEQGFSANWTIHELARNMPGDWLIDKNNPVPPGEYACINLFQPVTDYRIVERSIKYGLLFIALTFLGFVCFELTTSLRFHPVQYGVVGAGLVLFYLALLSLSEHVPFSLSYLIATVLLTTLISWYVLAMTGIWRLCVWMAGVVASLYTTLYILLQLEAFALLAGTAVLFAGLIALMYTTRSLTIQSPSA